MKIKKIISNPKSSFFAIKQKIEFRLQLYQAKHKQLIALKKTKGRNPINCVFFALDSSIWKYDMIYRIMLDNSRFNPTILVCPIVNYGRENMLKKMEQCFCFFKDKGYNVIKSYNEEEDEYFDVRRLSPDIIFYTNPYRGFIDERYYITHFNDILTVYVPYFMNCSNVKGFSNNMPLHNLVWRKYVETDYELQLAKIEQKRHGLNVVYTGYPGIEKLIDKKYKPEINPWKIKDGKLKKIIWAPHHTIEKGCFGHTCFLEYCDFMIEMAKKYEGHVQFVFKPHPLLKNKLQILWGIEKTNIYYATWESMANSSLCEDDYIDLFLTSDAMIHDSGSFIVEYLYVNKPVMRTINDIPLSEMFNRFALDCFGQYYLSNAKEEVEQFIQNVINDVDPLKEKRTQFVNDVLMPKGSPSQNIINDILDSIDNQILYRN